jgi:hypothetical protein
MTATQSVRIGHLAAAGDEADEIGVVPGEVSAAA